MPTTSTDEATSITLPLVSFLSTQDPPPAGMTGITDVDPGAAVGGIAIIGAVGNGVISVDLTGPGDGDQFTPVLVQTSPTNALLLGPEASFRYTPDGQNAEIATVTYRAWDQTNGLAAGTFTSITATGGETAYSVATDTATLIVTGVNNPPTISGTVAGQSVTDKGTVAPFTSVTIADVDDGPQILNVSVSLDAAAKGVLTNLGGFTAAGGGVYTFQGAAAQATSAIRGLTFDPAENRVNPGLVETTTFTIVVNDGVAAPVADSNTTVNSTSVNDAPTAAAVLASAVEDGPAVNGDFAGDDVDTDDDPATLVYQIVTNLGSGEGTVVNNGNGTFTFNPGGDFQDLAEGQVRNVSFTYQANDGAANSNVATVTIAVTGKNDAPTAANVAINAVEDGPAVNGAFAGDDVDSDDDQASLVYQIVADLGPGEGTVVNNGNGTFTFNPGGDFQDLAAGQTRNVSFTYRANDGLANSTVATVTITVTGTNDAPTAANVNLDAEEDGPAVIGVFGGDDADSDDSQATLSYEIVTGLGAGQGTVVNHGDGTFTFSPGGDFQDLAEGQIREVSFTYRANDGAANSGLATVTITVTGKNDAPTANAFTVVSTNIEAVIHSYQADDVDSDNDRTDLAYTITQPSQGLVTDNGNGTFTFDPQDDFDDLNPATNPSRDVTFTYVATDRHGADSGCAEDRDRTCGVEQPAWREGRQRLLHQRGLAAHRQWLALGPARRRPAGQRQWRR